AALTAAAVAPLVAGRPIAATDETDGAGDATLAPLGVGLYYVQETVTPSGYVGAAPFLVALPLTNPETLNDRLTVVHVYPKNAHVSISLDVRDADAVAVGDTVSWTSRSSIPNLPVLDGYRIVQEIDPKLELVGAAGGAPGDAAGEVVVALDCAGCPPLQTGVHYTRSYDPVTREITVDFTAAGLRVLEDAVSAHPDASVTVGYGTRVLGDGELRNRALLYADRASIDGDPGSAGPVSDTAVTKWGPLAILVHERGKPNVLIPGAKFRLFLSAEDAKAGRNPIVVDGTSEWTTDENGEIRVDGLRFSDFVDGLERDESDPLYRSYYVILTEIPEGYRGTKTPIALSVTSTVEPQIAVVELWRPQVGGDDDDDDGDQDGGLSTTGVRIAGIGLLGAILAIGGAMILARRRERDEDRAVQ
ncbi:SpaH/EbpB family LPXTG-anchored major pilin, partial [Leucobacter soli]|uniref:SpaH/EbpB family LPXTG-anchored major pilin n=1 Tax=Leucobacter soli TaxID=2812850 RepID=UPI003618544C